MTTPPTQKKKDHQVEQLVSIMAIKSHMLVESQGVRIPPPACPFDKRNKPFIQNEHHKVHRR